MPNYCSRDMFVGYNCMPREGIIISIKIVHKVHT